MIVLESRSFTRLQGKRETLVFRNWKSRWNNGANTLELLRCFYVFRLLYLYLSWHWEYDK